MGERTRLCWVLGPSAVGRGRAHPDSPNHVCIRVLLGNIVNKRIGYIVGISHLNIFVSFFFKKAIALHLYLVMSSGSSTQCRDCFYTADYFYKV